MSVSQVLYVGGRMLRLLAVGAGFLISTPRAARADSPCPPPADMRGDQECLPGAPSNVPRPVNVHTGNVWFDQLDVAIPGLGGPLLVSRSYNSKNAYDNTQGAFGRGWSHAYEQRIVVHGQEGIISLRKGDGVAIHYEDMDEDGVYRATVPISEPSWIELGGGSYLRRFPDGRTETYAASSGYWIAYTDPAGNQATLTRDSQGRLSRVTEPGGRFLAFTYDGDRITEVRGPAGLIAAYTYDDILLVDVSYSNGEGYHFTYDLFGQVLALSDRTGRVIERHEYAHGRGTTSEIDGGQEKYVLSYDESVTTVTDSRGNVTTYEYDHIWGRSHVTRIMHPGAESEEWTYDDRGRVLNHKTRAGSTIRYEYDGRGRLSATIDDLGHRATTSYTAAGRTETITTPDGVVRRMTYGPLGVTEVSVSHGAAKRSTRIEYDSRGRVSKTIDPHGKATLYSHNDSGDLIAVTDPLGATTRYTYDAMGRRISVTDALTDPSSTTVTYVYDTHGRLKTATHTQQPDRPLARNTYDFGGRLTSVTDALDRTTTYAYDFAGRLERVTDPANGVTSFGYDAMSNRTSITDAMQRVTRFEYDGNGRLVKTTFPGMPATVETLVYDMGGHLSQKTDRKGITTTYTYDALSRLMRKSYSDGSPRVSYTYDVMGRTTMMSNGVDTLRWTYDLLGELTSEKSAKNQSVVSYGYDPAGRRIAMALDGAGRAGYQYDDAGRLTGVTSDEGTFAFYYDALSRRTAMAAPNGVMTRYEYDAVGRLMRIGAERNGAPITHFAYTHDAIGNRLSKTTSTFTEFYRYDELSRLVEVQRTDGNRRWAYRYDAVGNRRYETIDQQLLAYSYNDRNQLLTRESGGMAALLGTVDEPSTVTVNGVPVAGSGQTFSGAVPVAAGGSQVDITARDAAGNEATRSYQLAAGSDVDQYEYDANGALVQKTADGHVWTYEWDAEGQLKGVTKDGTLVARFAYDPLGRRVEAVTGGVSTSYVYDALDILRETTPSSARTYVYGPGIDEPLVRRESGATLYYHADGLGSIVKLTDSNGAVVHTYQYDAWGDLETTGEDGYAYTGREWDAETGLYYYRSRYYDAKAARFISEDPITFEAGVNFYAYVLNRPTSLTDPQGLQVHPPIGPIGTPMQAPYVQVSIPNVDPGTQFFLYAEHVRVEGHARFGGGVNSAQRHQWASERMACSYGEWPTRLMGIANEVQGFLFHDLGLYNARDIWNPPMPWNSLPPRMSGQQSWAFQLSDLWNNEIGIARAAQHGRR